MEQYHREACKSLNDRLIFDSLEATTVNLFVEIFWKQKPTYEDYLYVFQDKYKYYDSEEKFYTGINHLEKLRVIKDRI